jgi:hypothetical protein
VGEGASNASPFAHPIPAQQQNSLAMLVRQLFQLDDLDQFSRQSISPASLRSDLDRNLRNNDRFHTESLIDITGIRTLIYIYIYLYLGSTRYTAVAQMVP